MYKVLIVDDEELVRHGITLEINWNELGCMIVAEASNGIEGLEAAHRYSPDIIVTDIRMPKMGGLEMVEKLREEENNVSVIFLTAFSDFTYARTAIKLYATDYLLKPFEDGELESAVLHCIEKIKASEEISAEEPLLKKGDKSKYVMLAIDYISKYFGKKDLNITEIADSIGVSEGHLSHIFKKETEYTVANYIIRFRMREATRLLKDCTNKVYEVADRVGYKDITYFSSTFKKIVGISPSEYQDRCKI